MKGFRKASLVFACMMLLLGTGFCVSSATTYHSYTFTLNRGQGVTSGSVYKSDTTLTTAGVIVTYSTAPGYKTKYYVKKAAANAIISDKKVVENKQWQGGRIPYKSVGVTFKGDVRLYGISSSITNPSGIRVSGQWTPA